MFRISGLPAADFAEWFELDAASLAARGGVKRRVDAPHAFPCRISLTDAAVGDEVLLINHEHLPVDSPYRSRHARGYQRSRVAGFMPGPARAGPGPRG